MQNSDSGISWIYNENDSAMDSLSLLNWSQIIFDRRHRTPEASEQPFWNNRFWRVCKVKANGALKSEYLLKFLKRKMKNNAYIANSDDTGEKRKPYQRNPVI